MAAVVIIHVIYCRGCRRAWLDSDPHPGEVPPLDLGSDVFPCACTCADPAAPGYEDWQTDPKPAEMPAGVWAEAAGQVMTALSSFAGGGRDA